MLSYPLELSFPGRPLLRIVDAAGRTAACVPEAGFDPHDVTVYGDERLRAVRFHARDELLNWGRSPGDAGRGAAEGLDHVLRGPDGRRLGAFGGDTSEVWEIVWRGAYTVADAAGEKVGRVYREDPLRPYRLVDLRGETVMCLLRRRPSGRVYGLDKTGGFSETEEELLLAGVVMALLDEWWRKTSRGVRVPPVPRR